MCNKTYWLDRLLTDLKKDLEYYEKQIESHKSSLDSSVHSEMFNAGLVTAYEIAADRIRRAVDSRTVEFLREDLSDMKDYGVGT